MGKKSQEISRKVSKKKSQYVFRTLVVGASHVEILGEVSQDGGPGVGQALHLLQQRHHPVTVTALGKY